MTVRPTTGQTSRPALGAGLIVATVFLMALQDTLIKWASSDITLWQIYVLRSLLTLPALALIAWRYDGDFASSKKAFNRWPAIRALFLVLMSIALYAAIPVLSLSALAAGFYTGPLFIALLSAMLLHEPVGKQGWFAIFIGFAGVLLIIKPGADAFSPAILLPVLSGFFYAFAAIITRSQCQDESPSALAIAFNLGLFTTGAAISLVLLAWTPWPVSKAPFLLQTWAVMAFQDWMLIATMSLLMVGIGLGLAAAYQIARPVIIATFDYSYLIFATLFGLLVFTEIPDIQTIAGMLLIAFGGLWIIHRQGKG